MGLTLAKWSRIIGIAGGLVAILAFFGITNFHELKNLFAPGPTTSSTPSTEATHTTPQAAQSPVCLDATNSRANNSNVRLWQCLDHPNQEWVMRGAQIIVADTLNSGSPVCLDATNSRANNTNVRLWQCLDHPNQEWVIDHGDIQVADTRT